MYRLKKLPGIKYPEISAVLEKEYPGLSAALEKEYPEITEALNKEVFGDFGGPKKGSQKNAKT